MKIFKVPSFQLMHFIFHFFSLISRLTSTKHVLEVFDYTRQSVTTLQNVINSKNDFSAVEAIMAKMYIFLQEK